MYDAGLAIALIEVLQRMALADFIARAVFAVEFIDILDEFAVKQMQRDALGADTAALTAVGAATGHMEGLLQSHLCQTRWGGRYRF